MRRVTCYERESYEYAKGRYSYDRETYCDTDGGDDCPYPYDFYYDDLMGSLHHVAYSDAHEHGCQTQCASLCDMSPHDLGLEGERLARTYLERRGWEIIESNWTCPAGEADIIARDGDEYVFVEVKTRLDTKLGESAKPELAVDKAKQQRYKRIAACYMAEHGEAPFRFDVIAISIIGGRTVNVRHLVDAFGCDY